VPPSRGKSAKRRYCWMVCAHAPSLIDESRQRQSHQRHGSWIEQGERRGRNGTERVEAERGREKERGDSVTGLWSGSVGWELSDQPVL